MLKCLTTAAVAGALLVAGVAPAGGATDVFRMPASFTLPAGQCADLPATLSVSGTGTATIRAHSSVDAQGRLHEHFAATITGTATDSAGGSYRFNYHNTATLTPHVDFPFVVHITDHFNLVGNGGANQIHTFFNLKILVSGPGAEELISAHFHGDPETCDPL